MRKVLRLTGNRTLLEREPKFKKSAKKVGDIDIDFLSYMDIYYNNGFRYIETGKKIPDYDIYRVGGKKGLSMLHGFIYKYGSLEGKTVVDSRKQKMLGNDKFSQLLYLEHNGYNTPKSLFLFIENEDNISKYYNMINKSEITFPMIGKYVDVDRGEGVFLIKSENDLNDFLKGNIGKGILFQEFIENNGDYRVLVVGGKVIGAFKRYNKESYMNNVSTGGTSTFVDIPENIKKISIDIANGFGYEISGVDFFIDDNNYSVIEINELPQYDGFEKITGISYSDIVMKYFSKLNLFDE